MATRSGDGAANVHHFPGTFYDYRWSTTLARRDKIVEFFEGHPDKMYDYLTIAKR